MIQSNVRVVCALLLVLVLSSAPGAWAGAPTDEFRDGVDRVFKILRDPEMKGRANATRRWAAIAKVSEEIFDFDETAKRSLGQHWEKRTPAERTAFSRLFTELIQRSYIAKVDQHGSAARVTFLGETVDEDYAVVRTTIPLSNGSIMPLDYRMHGAGGRWQVYDLSMDGISLLANYRAQFNKIIRTSSFEELVVRLKANKADFSPPSASPATGKAGR